MSEIEQSKKTRGADEEENTILVFHDEDSIEDMYLTFGVSGEEYGIGISYVTEVVGIQRIMEVPDVPHFIKGVINLRGKVIPVMDVRLRFNMEAVEYNERTVIIVLDINNVLVGLVVDYVSEVLEIPAADVEKPAQLKGTHNENSVIRGYGKRDEQVVMLLNIERLVSDHDIDLGCIVKENQQNK
ncbi:chemotaxis protein CheW [Candidatus Methylospira mobilis]|nr:chemotaxis protein CheW [Candidatus Methylospira mobilis]